MSKFDKRIFILTLSVVVLATCLITFPADDGLRHVGMAFSDFTSWGDVYPFSQFEELKDYDPWFGYDLTLRLIAVAVKHIRIGFRGIDSTVTVGIFGSIQETVIIRIIIERIGG